MKERIVVIAACLAVAGAFPAAHAADAGKAKTAASYLWLPSSARSAALGNGFAAFADDAAALYYNPACLGRPAEAENLPANRHELMVTSSQAGLDRTHTVLAYVYSFPRRKEDSAVWYLKHYGDPLQSAFGAGFISYGVGDIAGYDVFGAPQANFSDSESTIVLGYGWQVSENWAAGLALKRHNHTLLDAGASGLGADIGILYRRERLSLGLTARNLADGMEWAVPDAVTRTNDQYTEQVALQTVLGAACELSSGLSVLLDLDSTSSQDLDWHLGAEYRPAGPVAVRAGMDGYDPTFGFGLKLGGGAFDASLDYAYRMDMNGLSTLQFFTLTTTFNVPRKKG